VVLGYVSYPKLAVPYNILPTTEASDFKFGVMLAFAKAHRKITLKKNWAWSRASGAPKKIWGFHFNISAMAEASDLKISKWLEFSKVHHKIPPRKKVVWPWARKVPQNLGVAL